MFLCNSLMKTDTNKLGRIINFTTASPAYTALSYRIVRIQAQLSFIQIMVVVRSWEVAKAHPVLRGEVSLYEMKSTKVLNPWRYLILKPGLEIESLSRQAS